MEMGDLMRSVVNYIALVDRKAELTLLISEERLKQATPAMFLDFNKLEAYEHELSSVQHRIEQVRQHMKNEHYDPAVTG